MIDIFVVKVCKVSVMDVCLFVKNVGLIGVGFLVFVFGGILVLDLLFFFGFLRRVKVNLCQKNINQIFMYLLCCVCLVFFKLVVYVVNIVDIKKNYQVLLVLLFCIQNNLVNIFFYYLVFRNMLYYFLIVC